jgi:CelD/BcsL family acetyltransferase involved in cellulose biosynthesis
MWHVLSDLSEIARIVPEWYALAERDDECTVYQRPEWTLAWIRHLRGKRSCQVFYLENGGEPVAIFPMWMRDLGGISVLEFIGARGTDYLAPIVACDQRDGAYASFAQIFLTTGVDIVSFEDVPATHSLVHFCTASPAIGTTRTVRSCQCYSIGLPDTWVEYTRTLSPRRQRDVAYDRRHLQRACQRTRFVSRAPASAFPLHVNLHQLRRHSAGHEGAYATTEAVTFQQEIASIWESQGILRLSFLECGSRPVATVLAACWRRHVYAVTFGFDPALRRLSPGSVLLGLCIEDAIDDGSTVYDLSRGDDTYKASWLGRPSENVHITVGRNIDVLQAYERARRAHFAGHHFAPSPW